MSAKTLLIAAAALAASTTMTLPALAAGGDGTGPAGTGPGPAVNPPAVTQTASVRGQVMFNLLDANHDGSVDKDEYAALSTAIFSALDTNHDGKLTQDELRNRFAMLGERGPGRAGMDRQWQGRFDGRGQGRFDDRPGPRQGMMGRTGFNGPGPQQGPGNGPGYGPQGVQNFASIDTNNDGAISLDEFQAHMPVRGPMAGPQQ